MTAVERDRARHVDTASAAGRLTKHINPSAFLQWMLVICLALMLWPATFGGRFGMVIVAGTSMEPTYELGDAIITWREPVEIGDVVLYRIPEGVSGEGNPVIHRIVGGDGYGWVTQGDNATLPDKWSPSDLDVLGTARLKIPLGGYFLNLMRSWWFIAIMGGLAAGLLLWPEPEDEEAEAEEPVRQRKRGRHRSRRGVFA